MGENEQPIILEEKALEQILSSFYGATGLRAVFCNLEGEMVITSSLSFSDTPYCQLIKEQPQGKARCAKSYATAGREAVKWGEPYIFRCHAGLVGWAAPVLQEKEHVYTIICSQVLMWEPEDFFWEEIWEMTKDLQIDFAQLMEAAKKLRVISAKRVKAAADLLFVMANYLTRKGSIILEQRRAIQEQQAKLQELLQGHKQRQLEFYAFQKEKELLEKVKLGKVKQAETILNDILADEMLRFVRQPQLVKARLYELLVLISRAVMQREADLPILLKANHQHYQDLVQLEEYEQICYWAKMVLHEYISYRDTAKSNDIGNLIERVKDYIEDYYSNKLTIDEIARVVYLSPYYLCRMFKKHTGCTIMEYITNVRVKRAQDLLINSQDTIQEIGEKVGFGAPSYFSNVFKRSTGLTPLQYRRQAGVHHSTM
jgi:two-component system response regulator YesN